MPREASRNPERLFMRRICVFCGSSTGKPAAYAEHARQLANALVARQLGLVFGGGHIGLMGVLADTVLKAGGQAIGVIPQALVDKELAHGGLSELHVVSSMHERKGLMADLSHGFLALPGGYGTADELFEILTWAQLGLHSKPIGLLNVAGFFDPLLAWLDHAVAEGFIKSKHRQLILEAADADRLLHILLNNNPPETTDKWISEDDR